MTQDMKNYIHDEVQNLHLELIRQFQIQQVIFFLFKKKSE